MSDKSPWVDGAADRERWRRRNYYFQAGAERMREECIKAIRADKICPLIGEPGIRMIPLPTLESEPEECDI
jgi:hypothetical protein